MSDNKTSEEIMSDTKTSEEIMSNTKTSEEILSDTKTSEEVMSNTKISEKVEKKESLNVYQARRIRKKWSKAEIKDLEAACVKVWFLRYHLSYLKIDLIFM